MKALIRCSMVCGVLLIAGACNKSAGSATKTAATTSPAAAASATTAPPTTAKAVPTTAPPTTVATTVGETRPHDKHFAVAGLQLKQDFQGDFGGTTQVQNTGTKSYTATFKFTFHRNGQVVGTADGSVQGVSPNQTVSADLISQDKYDGTPVTYTFQVNAEF